MQDSIIGYLLGALDDAETARFEAELKRDPQLQARLRDAARSLLVLKQDRDDIEPPRGLAQSTCALVQTATRQVFRQAPFERSAETEEWTLIDICIAATVLLAACLLFFPAVNNSRYHAQIAGCQNNLRSIGRALIEYSSYHAQGFFPQVPETGKLAVAGMYAPTLISAGLIKENHWFFCPSSSSLADETIYKIPTVEEVLAANGQELAEKHCQMGGGYGYTLGVRTGEGRLRGIRNQSRAQFAIMSDSPNSYLCEAVPRRGLHRNLLFESGCVRTITTACWGRDQLFRNDYGQVSAGVHDCDIVIGGSATPPTVHAVSIR